MRIAYLDCFSGISGDMFLGALVDAGLPLHLLQETVAALDLGVRIEVSRVSRCAISATKVDVWIGDEKDMPREEHWQKIAHSHDQHRHEHGHCHDHGLNHPPVDPHLPAGSPQRHRGLKEIREIIHKAAIAANAKPMAIAMFEALGAAEAKIHNVAIEEVHFHEVGAVDAIVDMVCAAVGAHALAVDRWLASPVNVGGGTVQCAHGTFPVPAPATVELLKGAPVFSSGLNSELVTPTGAAILKVLAQGFGPMPALKATATGYGAGARDFASQPNVLRITVGDAVETQAGTFASAATPQETISVLEASLDDLNPQVFGYVMDRALAEGALDVFGMPVQMKKNRPGMLLTVLCRPEDAARLTRLLFAETTTLGIRMRQERRQVLLRRTVEVQTPWGQVRMKVANLNGTVANYAPEFEDCRRIAGQRHVPLKQVMQEAIRAYLEASTKSRSASS